MTPDDDLARRGLADVVVAAILVLVVVLELRSAIAVSGVAVLTYYAVTNAAAWTLDHAESLIPPMRTELQLRRDVAVAALREIGLPVASPQGAMYLWVPLPAGIASADFATSALEAEGVVVLPGAGFGAAGEGFFRIALTVPPARLREAITRLGRVIAQLLAAQPVSA